jgi:hypothetical protein
MSSSATVTPGFAHFLSDPPQRFPDGRWYACYRVRRDYGDHSETDSETSYLFRTEGEASRWYEQEATRLGFPEPAPPLAAH